MTSILALASDATARQEFVNDVYEQDPNTFAAAQAAIVRDAGLDLFRCESLIFKTHSVMVVMDQFSRRIVGFAVHAGVLDGPAVCRMFNHAIAGALTLPRHLSSDNDPLFEFHRWKANLRLLEVTEIKTVPEVPLSHPFIERVVGTIRRELLDQIPFWGRQGS